MTTICNRCGREIEVDRFCGRCRFWFNMLRERPPQPKPEPATTEPQSAKEV